VAEIMPRTITAGLTLRSDMPTSWNSEIGVRDM
jgi:hypothetical protein